MKPLKSQKGAAILTAMLIVTLVATLSANALWQQWRGIEIESAERARLQSSLLLIGASDWGRLILREDARAGATDHLSEPWAVPLREARLSTFLANAGSAGEGTDVNDDVFLSGEIADVQGRLNITNLVLDGKLHPPSVRAFGRLFNSLQIPAPERAGLLGSIESAMAESSTNPVKPGVPQKNVTAEATNQPLLPARLDQLRWLGLSAASIEKMQPYVTILPVRTSVNINTAPAVVLHACIENFDMPSAQSLVAKRASSHFRTLELAERAGNLPVGSLTEPEHGVGSRYFEISGQLRMENRMMKEVTLVRRDLGEVKVLWRQRKSVLQPDFIQ